MARSDWNDCCGVGPPSFYRSRRNIKCNGRTECESWGGAGLFRSASTRIKWRYIFTTERLVVFEGMLCFKTALSRFDVVSFSMGTRGEVS